MEYNLIADFIVNFCGALGVLIALFVFRARDPQGSLTRRFTIALALVAGFFILRGLAWVLGWHSLDRLSVALAAFIPLAVLVIVETILRQHAPLFIKIGTLVGGFAIGLFTLFLPYTTNESLYLVLAAFQVTAFVAFGILLLTTPAGSLSVAETRNVRWLCLAAFFVVPFVLTDFRTFLPEFPVRVGALGTLIVVLVALLGNQAGGRTSAHVMIFLIRVIGALGTAGLVALTVPGLNINDFVRLAAVSLSCILLIGLVVDVARAVIISGEPGLLQSVATSTATNRDTLFEELRGHALFKYSVRINEIELAEYDPEILRPALHGRIVVRRSDYPWGMGAVEPATERLQALLLANNASHLVVAGTEPLDLVALHIPLLEADRATETAVLMAGRMLAAYRMEESQ